MGKVYVADVILEGKWSLVGESAKAIRVAREDGIERWFPKKVATGPNDDGSLQVAEWFMRKNALPALQEGAVSLPKSRGGVAGWVRGALSHSALSVYARCPRAYYFAYVKRVPRTFSQALSFGNVVHSVLELIYECDFEQADPDRYLSALVDRGWERGKGAFHRHGRAVGKWRDELSEEALKQARWGLGQLAGGEISPDSISKYAPDQRERRIFSQDERFGGYADAFYSTEPTRLVEFKTGRVPNKGVDGEHRRQGLMYAHLCREEDGVLPEKVEIWYLRGQRIETIIPNPEEVNGLVEQINAWADEIASLRERPEPAWPAVPSQRACSWCDARPWCGKYQSWASEQPVSCPGSNRLVAGEVQGVVVGRGRNPTKVTIQPEDGGSPFCVKGWDSVAHRMKELTPGDRVKFVAMEVDEDPDEPREAIGTVFDPAALIRL